jgi:hypothetical protein
MLGNLKQSGALGWIVFGAIVVAVVAGVMIFA